MFNNAIERYALYIAWLALWGLHKTAAIDSRRRTGQYLSFRLRLKILVKWAATKVFTACRALFVIPSGPGTLSGDAVRIAFSTSLSSIGGFSV